MKYTLTVNCCLCSEKHEATVDLPAGWKHRYGGIDDEEGGFCPKHAPVAKFAEAQCPGCVGGWADCSMWRAFAYSGRSRDIGPTDFAALERGICPRRTNGTLSVTASRDQCKMESFDLSERAPDEAGKAFAEAIRDYCTKYP